MNPQYIFDIDGVITEPYQKKPNPAILEFIAKRLSEGTATMLATGGSVSWVNEHIVYPIGLLLPQKNMLDMLLVSAEKGAVIATYEQGTQKIVVDAHFSLPEKVQTLLMQKAKEYKHIYFDTTKQTMATIVISGGKNETEVSSQLAELTNMAQWIEKEVLPQFPQISLEKTIISLDIEVKNETKKISADNFLLFLYARHIAPTVFLAFGDSPSDLVIGEELFAKGHPISFGYVGKEPLVKQYPFPIFYPAPQKFYDQGVLDLLTHNFL